LSASRRTTDEFASPQPSRQQLRSEEGALQGQEQAPDTRRAAFPQGSPQGSATTEHYDLSPEKVGLINIGEDDDPVFVKHEEIPDEKIIEFVHEQAENKAGEDLIMDVLTKVKKELRYIVQNSGLPS
jgi:hypothetical protein